MYSTITFHKIEYPLRIYSYKGIKFESIWSTYQGSILHIIFIYYSTTSSQWRKPVSVSTWDQGQKLGVILIQYWKLITFFFWHLIIFSINQLNFFSLHSYHCPYPSLSLIKSRPILYCFFVFSLFFFRQDLMEFWLAWNFLHKVGQASPKLVRDPPAAASWAHSLLLVVPSSPQLSVVRELAFLFVTFVFAFPSVAAF